MNEVDKSIPTKLKIGGYDYDVKFADLIKEEEKHGTHNANTNVITLNNTTKQEIIDSTLIHEILEAINYHYELGLSHPIISTLETSLYQVLKDNKLKF